MSSNSTATILKGELRSGATSAAPGRMTVPQKLARRAMRHRLSAVHGRGLQVTDPIGSWHVGESDEAIRVSVHNARFYTALATRGSIGAAESYVRGEWDCEDLSALFGVLIENQSVLDDMESGMAKIANQIGRVSHLFRRNSRRGSALNIQAHYDISNDFFAQFLDATMTYSCAYFDDATTSLEQASIAKLDRLCQKLDLGPEDHVLEIGTGWGSFAIHAARNYGCRVTTTTISPSQHAMAQERIERHGLAELIDLRLTDYRDLDGTYDKVVSIEMIEAVGHEFLPVYFQTCAERLRPGGKLAIQAITMPNERYEAYLRNADFIQLYVFPGSCCPSLDAIGAASESTGTLELTGSENIAAHYAETLRRWRARFVERLTHIEALGHDEQFQRLWLYYFQYCEAGFATEYLGTHQLIFEKSLSSQYPGASA